jgi:hypothetical protein
MPQFALGLDFGTESGRALIVNVATGEIVGSAVHRYADGVIDERLPGTSIQLEPDTALQNPNDYIETLKHAVPEALQQGGVRAADVIGIGVDFTACTILPTRADGTPLCALNEYTSNPHAWVKLWKHHAAQPEADRINALARERNEPWLASLPSDEESPHAIKIGADLRYWQVVAKFALELLARQRVKPTLQKDGDKFIARWQPLLDEPSEQERWTRLIRAMPPICRAVFRDEKDAKRDAPAPRDWLDDFLATTIDTFARWHAELWLGPKEPQGIAALWIDALTNDDGVVAESSATLAAFYEQYRAWAEPVGASFDSATLRSGGGETFRICFRLDPPQTDDAEGIVTPKANARDGVLSLPKDWSLRYLLQANDDPSLAMVARSRGAAANSRA